MKTSYLVIALLGLTASSQAVNLEQIPADQLNVQMPCDEALPITKEQLDIELDYFSRSFDRKHYDNAMKIHDELVKNYGQNPKLSVHTWELYDASFAFPRVRRYDLVQQHMDLIQHFEDNLNENFSNGQLVTNFIKVCKDAQTALNAKYHDGEFSDPAGFDPQEEHKTTWATVKL